MLTDIIQQTMILDARLPYRIGRPILPVLPLTTTYDEQFPKFNMLSANIRKTLLEEEVYFRRFGPVKRLRPGQHQNAVPHTLLVEAYPTPDDAHLRRWVAAVHRLHNLLQRVGIECQIEILDEAYASGTVSEPISDHHYGEVLRNWPSVAYKILDMIQVQQWLSLNCVLRRPDKLNATPVPTALISASNADAPVWWDTILPHLRTIAQPMGLQVELVYARDLQRAGDESTLDTTIDGDAYDKQVLMGASIGSKTTSHVRTVGTYIRLRGSACSEDQVFGLTNHHVAGENPGLWIDKTWLPPSHQVARNERLAVFSRSDKDHDIFHDYTTQELQEFQRIAYKERDGPRGLKWQKAVEDLGIQLKATKADRLLGTVWASSGLRTIPNPKFTDAETQYFSTVFDTDDEKLPHKRNPKNPPLKKLIESHLATVGKRNKESTCDGALEWYTDWCLIKVASSRQLLPHMPMHLPRQVLIYPEAKADRYASIIPGAVYEVTKRGRTSNWTTGHINGAASYVNLLREDEIAIAPVNLTHRYGGRVALAYAIVSSSSHQDFIASGDSGCAVLLNRGRPNLRHCPPGQKQGSRPGTIRPHDPHAIIVGTGFASDGSTMLSYMVPIDRGVRDIERVTGAKVITPVFDGLAVGDDVWYSDSANC